MDSAKDSAFDKVRAALSKFRNYQEEKCSCCSHVNIVCDNGYPKFLIVSEDLYRALSVELNNTPRITHHCGDRLLVDGVTILMQSEICVVEDKWQR